MVSAVVKAVKQQEIKELVVVFCNFHKKYLQNLKCNVKQAYIFHLTLLGIASSLILSIKSRGSGGFLLNGQNLFSVTKVTCQQSIKHI